MASSPEFDLDIGHRFFSAHCFNRAWEIIDKPDRTDREVDAMLHAAHASAWHWLERPDYTNENLSISYWQLSRVYAIAGSGDHARRYAQLCLEISQEESPFLIGYAYEALARSAMLEGDTDAVQKYVRLGYQALGQIEDHEERELLRKDLDSLES